MGELYQALFDPSMPFLRFAMLGGVLASLAFGIMGSYVVVRKISSIAGAIAHCVLGGIGAALYCQNRLGWTWCDPMYGAIVAALLAAVLLGLVSIYARQREDTVIGALWAIGMAIGILFIAKTPGYVDAMSYLFGNILLVTRRDLALIVGLDVLVVVVAVVFYHQFLAVCFDSRFARLRGIRVQFYYLLLLLLTALTIVLLLPVVGIVMVIALLTLPAAVAGHFSKRLWAMMALASVFSMVFVAGGIGISYSHDLPAGPVIIILAGVAYLAAALFRVIRGRRAA